MTASPLTPAQPATTHRSGLKRIVILISGRGSNMEAIVQRCRVEDWPASVVAVISNRPDATGLNFARAQGVQTAVVDHKGFQNRPAFDAALADCIDRFQPDLVVLAGFMRILGEAFVARYAGRLLNIHPSLLPAFPGLHTHQRALDTGCAVAGATVHFVTSALDHGPIVMQSAVPILHDDTAETLAARVLATEHQIYPRAIRWFVEDRLQLTAGLVQQLDGESRLLIEGPVR
jgi:phosphoribosylglycinamide formyltransferase 1